MRRALQFAAIVLLISAAAGMGLGVMGDKESSAIVLMVILTTLITPPILTLMIRRTAARSAA